MASEVIKLNLIPKGEMPVFHASQFDTGRLITCELYRGEDAYDVPEGYTVELHCRKVDNNIVTMASTLINDNVVTFTSTEQLTACNGNNLCEVAILDEGYRIGTLNFILEVEVDPLKGGINSTSEIHNLESQIEDITTEIIGENYYDKSEVDTLLADKADADSVYTKTETDAKLALKANASDVYTKSQTDTLLNAKANSSDVYTKGQVDTALAGKADVSDLPDMDLYYTKTATDTLLAAKADASTVTASLATKADKSDTYTKEQVDALIDNIFPTLTASGRIASFVTALTKPLVSVIADEGASAITRCGVNLFSDKFSEYTKPVNYYIKKIPLKQGATYTIKATLKGTAITGCIVGIAQDNDSYPFIGQYSLIKTDGTTQTFQSITIDSAWVSPKLIVYCSGESQFNDLFENYEVLLVEGTDTTYHAYNGQTVPVADATTLETEAGINHVYADAGDITVQYKYMSI